MDRSQLPTYEFTEEGFTALQKEQEELLNVKRPDAVEDLRKAREMGDLSENGYYKAARAKLSSIDSRLRRLALLLKYGKVIKSEFDGTVQFGCTVTVDDGRTQRTFYIVGPQESNPMEGKLSTESPIGKELLGKCTGEKVQIDIPAGKATFAIIDVKKV